MFPYRAKEKGVDYLAIRRLESTFKLFLSCCFFLVLYKSCDLNVWFNNVNDEWIAKFIKIPSG